MRTSKSKIMIGWDYLWWSGQLSVDLQYMITLTRLSYSLPACQMSKSKLLKHIQREDIITIKTLYTFCNKQQNLHASPKHNTQSPQKMTQWNVIIEFWVAFTLVLCSLRSDSDDKMTLNCIFSLGHFIFTLQYCNADLSISHYVTASFSLWEFLVQILDK